MHIKIRGEMPPTDDSSLCNTCRHARITRGRKLDEELVYCSASHIQGVRITFKVTACSMHSDRRLPTYFELLPQAWILRPESGRRPAGFVRSSELRDEDLARYIAARRT
jgi:hypothetical protein